MAFMVNCTQLNVQTAYVSSVAANGIPVGNDLSGVGTQAAPFLTWDRAVAVLALGGSDWLNGTALSPTVYQSTTATVISKAMTVRAVAPKGAVLAGVTTAPAVSIAPTAGSSILLQDIIVDPSRNSGGTGSVAISLASQATVYSLTPQNTLVQNWSTFGMTAPSGTLNANVRISASAFNGSAVQGGIDIRTLNSGSFQTDTGTSVVLTAQNLASAGGIYVGATAVGPTAKILDTTINVTSTVTASNYAYGGYLANMAGSVIDGDSQNTGTRATFTVSTNAAEAAGATVATNKAGNSTELPCDFSVIRNLIVYNYAVGGGWGAALSGESGDRTKQNFLSMANVDVYGNAQSQAAGVHGLFNANTTDSSITNSRSQTVGIGIVDKLTLRSTLSNLATTDFNSSGILAKGTTNGTWTNLSATAVAGNGSVPLMHIEADLPGSGTNTTGLSVTGCTLTNNGALGAIMVYMETGQTATFANNTYVLASGTLAAMPFIYQGTAMTPSQWKATVEPTATFVGFS